MKRIVLILTLIHLSLIGLGQDVVLTSPDFRDGKEGGIAVKWIAEKLLFTEGFNIYRKSTGTDWKKLNSQPINVKSSIANLDVLPAELKGIYQLIQKEGIDKLQDNNLARAFLKLDLYRTQQMPEMMGTIWYDETTVGTTSYQYKVTAITNTGSEKEIGITENITAGQRFKQLPVPDSIQVLRSETLIQINWKMDEKISVSTVVEKSVNNGAFKKYGELPLYVASKTDGKGNVTFPEFFIEENIHPDSTVSYRFASVDLFGQIGDYSKEFKRSPVDLTPPPAPQNTTVIADDRIMKIDLKWEYPNPPSDLDGFIVLQRDSLDAKPKRINADIIAMDLRTYSFTALSTSNSIITVAAIDKSGNMSESQLMQVQIDDFKPPAIPSDVSVTLDSGNYKITWSANMEADLMGYYIYRYLGQSDSVSMEDYFIITPKPYKESSYIDSLGNGLKGTIFYAIAAIDSNYNLSPLSIPATYAIPDITAPDTPFITKVNDLEGNLEISWMQNSDDDLDAFLLYRASAQDTIILEQNPESVSFLDEAVKAGITYEYYMVGRDLSGNKSPISNRYQVVVSGVDESIFDKIKPSNITLKYIKSKKVNKLYWSQKFTKDNLGVVIYKGETADDLFPVSGLLKKSEFLDKRVKEGATYYYQVRTFATNGLKNLSAIKEITIKKQKVKK